MRKTFYFFVKTVLVLGLLFAAGCSKPDDGNGDEGGNNGNNNGGNPNTPVADPEGTIMMSVRNWDNGTTRVPINDGLSNDPYGKEFTIDRGNNFTGGRAGNTWHFVSVGKVNGLGNVTKIPDSGWSTTLAVTPGYGYVCAYANTYGGAITFARIYVEEWILAAGTNGIIGAKIKYQYPFNGTAISIGLSQNSVTLGDAYMSSPVSLNKVSCVIDIVPSDDWFYYGDFDFDGSKVTVQIKHGGSYGSTIKPTNPINPTLTVSSPGLPDEYIKVSP